jgi:hypothetical protein
MTDDAAERRWQDRRQGERRSNWRSATTLRQLAILEDLNQMLAGWVAQNPTPEEKVAQLRALVARHEEEK